MKHRQSITAINAEDRLGLARLAALVEGDGCAMVFASGKEQPVSGFERVVESGVVRFGRGRFPNLCRLFCLRRRG